MKLFYDRLRYDYGDGESDGIGGKDEIPLC